MENRPTPEDMLERVNAENSHRGKLKIFFGSAAGVGKTCAMLEAAQHLKKDGVDVVVGYLETHGRKETEVLVENLEVLPLLSLKYKKIKLQEFDIDAAIKRNPKVILVDELAHTNAPGARHPKRWQDVEELQDKGIDVYTTLNVQHCESVNSIVTQVTGITVRETVPDTIIETANEVKLVDTSTEDLLERLKNGKIYLGNIGNQAAQNFFQPGNLIALRELALRYTERNVNVKLMDYRKSHEVSKTWNVRDRFLVYINPEDKEAESLIRASKRIAFDLGIEWFVVLVESPSGFSKNYKKSLSKFLQSAEKLGAKTSILFGKDAVGTIIEFARLKNITMILIGKPKKPKWTNFFRSSMVENLARKCGEIDLYILSGDKEDISEEEIETTDVSDFSWNNFLKTALLALFCTLINFLLFPLIPIINLIMVYFLGMLWTAFYYDQKMSVFFGLLSLFCFNLFFAGSDSFFDSFFLSHFVFVFIIMIIAGLTVSILSEQFRRQTQVMQTREDRLQTLYDFSRDLSKSSYSEELFKITLFHIEKAFRCPAVILIPNKKNKLICCFREPKEAKKELTSAEFAVAEWSYKNKKSAGKGTSTLPKANGIYLPFNGIEKTFGVLGVFAPDDKPLLDPDQFHLLETFVSQAALAVEGAELAVKNRTNWKKIDFETTKIQNQEI